MVKHRLVCLLISAAALLFVGSLPARADTTVTAQLHGSNHSGVTGTATLTAMDSGTLRVVINARGHVPGLPHAQHIHGSMGGGHFMCPSAANDTDGDGLLTNEEAAGEYGKVFFALTTRGDTSPSSGLATDRMPVADASGRIHYDRTISADELPDGLLRHLSEVHVVQHGIDVNNNDRYDVAGAGVSTSPRTSVDRRPGGGDGPRQLWGGHGGQGWHGTSRRYGDRRWTHGSFNVTVGILGAVLLGASLVALWRRRPGRVSGT